MPLSLAMEKTTLVRNIPTLMTLKFVINPNPFKTAIINTRAL
jgi:hypothetical protein